MLGGFRDFSIMSELTDEEVTTPVIQGALDGLHANGLIAGIYSTYLQFPLIAGTGYSPGVPIWIADAPTSVAAWVADCSDLTKRFGGGQPWLVQWLGLYSPTGFDQDYACPQNSG